MLLLCTRHAFRHLFADFCVKTGLGQAFVGMIILPIAGNACEHLAAVVMAAKNKMNLSLGIAIGSGLQISMFAIPFTVLVGWVSQCWVH